MSSGTEQEIADRSGSGRGWPRLAKGLGIAGCGTGCVATVLPLWPLWSLYEVPPGTVMRPMALTALLALCAAVGLFISLPLCLAALGFGWRARRLALFGIVMSAAAIFLGFNLFDWIVSTRHFVLAD